MNFGKAGSRSKPAAVGIRYDTSVYGATIPPIIGRVRVSPKMIFGGHFKTHKASTKKLGGKKTGGGAVSYSANFDWLLGYAPIVAIGDVWRNKDNFWLVGVSSQTFTAPSNGPFHITNNPGPFVAIISVLATVPRNGTINDYGSPGAVSFSGTMQQPLYPAGLGTPYRNIAPGGFDWGSYGNQGSYSVDPTDPHGAPGTIFSVANVNVNSSFPVTVFYWYSLKSKRPMAAAGLQAELTLGSGDAFNYPGGGQFQVIYPEFSGMDGQNVDMGSSNTAPNDNVEALSLYAYSQNGDANPADAMLDVILSGNPVSLNGHAAGTFNWNHGLGFGVKIIPQGKPEFPNTLADPPNPL